MFARESSYRKDRPVLVTGCSSGIGRCVAAGLRERGYRVIATARESSDVESLAAEGLEALRLDLDDSTSIVAAVEEVLSRTGGALYALFNNAAWGQSGAIEDLRREVLRAQFETNVFGTLELTNRVLPTMRRQGYGRIIQNSSMLGFVALPYRGAYIGSKYALEGLTDTLRLELRGTGIQISVIEPGPIHSRFRANALEAFQRNIDSESSPHRVRYRVLAERLAEEGPVARFSLPPEAVLKRVAHALESPRPKLRYRVTFPAHLFGVLKCVLPDRALDHIVARR
jgi:NAD(P)-dependent dehydrogenase (short-subunit alcohol dehydrogenase family)